MPETLTESFCERCGTRYEFKAPTRLNPLRKTRGFIGGLRNYLTSQDDLSDAMGDAMRSEEDALAAAQLEAFHESFNFCIDCRQYTCVNCWNDDAGRCRSCAPIPGTDDLAERLAAAVHGQPTGDAVAERVDSMPEDQLQRRLGLDAWPSSDLPVTPAANGHVDVAWPEMDVTFSPFASADRTPAPTEFERPFADDQPAAGLVPEPEPVVPEAEPQPEPVLAEAEPAVAAPEPVVAEAEPELTLAGVDLEAEPWPIHAELEPAPAAEEAEAPAGPRLLHVVAWDEDAPYRLHELEPEPEVIVAELEALEGLPEAELEAAPELDVVPPAAEAEADTTMAELEQVELEPEPEAPAAAVEPEPAPEPQPRAPTPRIAPISETILRFPTQRAVPPPPVAPVEPTPVAAQDESPDVAARRAQLDLLGLGDPGQGPVVPERPSVLPYRSRGAAAGGVGQGVGFWEASAREVASAAAHIGVQNCGECGLSLSANARFCRRCGTRQARSA